ncbi:hypothetical protein Nepgr_023640 [Nepenthes gracilis]|uniref:J domain-containing protein n=1 Tax=Nepenthes gracilis TaxID=150966 RepID=A0AAD3T1A1_NEPGR|nr:hypothetical protein Nepgr_023640 [Nepenthes gracilis]
MGKRIKTKRKHTSDTDTTSSTPRSSSSSSSSSEVETSSRRHRRSKRRRPRDDERRSSRKEERRAMSRKRRDNGDGDRHGERKRRKDSKRRSRRESKGIISQSDGSESGLSGNEFSEPNKSRVGPESVVKDMLEEFPSVATDLKQLLQMIDNGQAVDIKGISEKLLMKHLKKLFLCLNLKHNGDGVFLLRSNARLTLETVGPIISSQIEASEQQVNNPQSVHHDVEFEAAVEDHHMVGPNTKAPAPRRRIGPEMPSSDLLDAAAKLTEAQAELREAELEQDNELFIGPPPPAMVTEVESANEAERFEEVTRIMGVEFDTPYDVLGVNHNMAADNIKKRYWKLSLMVHPDKCSHPQAHQAFIKLNKAFKDLQDPDKRNALDEKIKKKEEEEEMKAELQSMREAAKWRQSQGISMEGDDILLADLDVKPVPKRDEWMTTLPPERKPDSVSMQSAFFSRTGKEGRGDTSIWTDTPSDRAQKAKMNYLKAYDAATSLASNEEQKKRTGADADLVDQYNKAKRSKSLVQKHKEEAAERSHPRRKSKQQQQLPPAVEEEWVGKHPWKPWDRERDLTAGRQSVKLDSEAMVQGLASRFSSGTFQRNFL